MKRRLRIFALAAVCAGVVVLSGCAPGEEPTPTPTAAFASDEEAFAAAEETYRAYVDALNQVDLSDPDTFEPVYALTTGEVNASERKQLTTFHADSWVVSGESALIAFEAIGREGTSVSSFVCIDVSDVELVDAEGVSMVNASRLARSTYQVSFLESTSTTGFVIEQISPVETDLCS